MALTLSSVWIFERGILIFANPINLGEIPNSSFHFVAERLRLNHLDLVGVSKETPEDFFDTRDRNAIGEGAV